ncbi:MAG: hypothetical protein ACREHD_21735 [Pirellulales bacterium]
MSDETVISVLRHLAADRRTKPVWAVAIACCGVFLLSGAASEAVAACGDYVMVDGEHSTGAFRPGDHIPAPPVTQCNGPNCHRQLPPSQSPWREMLKTPSTDQACVVVAHSAPPPSGTWSLLSWSARPMAGYRRDVEHPPRRIA